MRSRSLPAEAADSAGIDLTPLLDVVFIMLIFFIVTASFVRETGLDVLRSESPADSGTDSEAIVVRIDAENGFWIDGRSVSPAALSANLAERHTRLPGLPVLIQPDRASTTTALVRAIDAANLARIRDVAVADATGNSPF
jgi:biopolymer transport protein ExbD